MAMVQWWRQWQGKPKHLTICPTASSSITNTILIALAANLGLRDKQLSTQIKCRVDSRIGQANTPTFQRLQAEK